MNENIFIMIARIRNQIQNPIPILPVDINKIPEIKILKNSNYINVKR